MRFEPLGDRVLVMPDKAPETSEGGIILPARSQQVPQQGTVVAVGPGKRLDDGTTRPVNVDVGDTVAYSKYGGTEIEMNAEKFLLLDESQVLGIFRATDAEEPAQPGETFEQFFERRFDKGVHEFVNEVETIEDGEIVKELGDAEEAFLAATAVPIPEELKTA